MKLLINALTKFLCGLLLVGLLIFLSAGTLCYTYGWLFIGLLFVPMLIAGLVMFFKSPVFLAKRLEAKEKQATQKGVVALSGLIFIAGFVVAGLDFRFGWSKMPVAVAIAASMLFLGNVLPATKAICIYHKGSYDRLGEAYAYIYRYAAENGYRVADFHRECYIDGIWNKENVEDPEDCFVE